MSQVVKSASALERAFLAILLLELDMTVRLFARSNSPAFMAIVGQFALLVACQRISLIRRFSTRAAHFWAADQFSRLEENRGD
jgi:hypothetical protein